MGIASHPPRARRRSCGLGARVSADVSEVFARDFFPRMFGLLKVIFIFLFSAQAYRSSSLSNRSVNTRVIRVSGGMHLHATRSRSSPECASRSRVFCYLIRGRARAHPSSHKGRRVWRLGRPISMQGVHIPGCTEPILVRVPGVRPCSIMTATRDASQLIGGKLGRPLSRRSVGRIHTSCLAS